MRLVILGPPGAGKGTQAKRLADAFAVPVISTGDVFRKNIADRTELGVLVDEIMKSGKYAPDEVTNDLVRNRLAEDDALAGFVLDGYPRTAAQVDELDDMLSDLECSLDVVLDLTVNTDEVVGRLLRRAELEGRPDDTEDVIRHRLDVYAEQTAPLVDLYGGRGLLLQVDGMGEIDEVTERLLKALNREGAAVVGLGRAAPVELGRVGSTRCLVVNTRRPWDVPVDGIVLSTGGEVLGALGRTLQDRFPRAPWTSLDLAKVFVDAPGVVPGNAVSPSFICATLHDDPKIAPTLTEALRNISPAITAAVRRAAEIRCRTLLIPLLGAGGIGLSSEAAARALIPAVRTALATPGFEQVIFLARTSEEALAIREAWPTRRTLAGGVTSDLVDPAQGIPLASDQLGVGVYAEMMAAVIAAEATPTPLSVGLFGEWGSGKSSFMGLLRQQISERASFGAPYLPNIVQIGFNAWTYADTNLWASLGDEIFRQLAGLEAHESAERERQLTALRHELDTSGERAQQLRRASETAQHHTAELRAELERIRRDRNLSLGLLLQATDAELKPEWKRLGIDDEIERGQVLVDHLRGTRTDALTLRRALTDRRAPLLGALAFISALAILAGLLTRDQIQTWLAGLGTTGLIATWAVATSYLMGARRAMRRLASFVRNLEQAQDEQLNRRTGKALQAIRTAEAREHVLQSEYDQVLAKAGELGRELAELSPGRRLYSFLTERAASADYRANLGLTSIIRRDFEQLADLMNEWDPTQHEGIEKPIDRIVLYIDDLDRCSPEQVVQVLQAVHLLLALDLFVVVVGVDPRWLLHSLRQQYPSNINGNRSSVGPSSSAGEDDASEQWRTSPQDYLEKIFNIPFVLPGLTPTGFESMIRELSAAEPSSRRPHHASPGQDGSGQRLELTSTDDAGPYDVSLGPSQTEQVAPPVQQGSEADQVRHGQPVELEPLTEPELTLLSALTPLVRSPREGKRLFNLYRMLRSTQNLSAASDFLGSEDEPGEYQAVAVLLGLLTAEPVLLGHVLTAAPDTQRGVIGGICRRETTSDPWAVALERLRPREDDHQWHNDVAADLSARESGRWSDLVERASVSGKLVTLPDLKAFCRWGPHVARFSFALAPLYGPRRGRAGYSGGIVAGHQSPAG